MRTNKGVSLINDSVDCAISANSPGSSLRPASNIPRVNARIAEPRTPASSSVVQENRTVIIRMCLDR